MDAESAGSLLRLAHEVVPDLRGVDRQQAFATLEARHDELIDALAWLVQQRQTDEAISLARALGPFWQGTRRLEEGTDWFERVLDLPGGDDEVRGRAYLEAGLFWFWRGEDDRATMLIRRAQELSRRLEAPTVPALALTALARIELRKGDLDAARRLCLEALELGEHRSDPIARGSAAHVLGVTAQMSGDLAEARRWMTERIELARADGNLAAIGFEGSNLAMVERQLGDYDRAEELSREALDIFRRRRDEWSYPFGLLGLAAVAVHRGELERGATLIGAADARIAEQGVAWPPDERPHYDATVAALEEAMEPDELERARAAGRALSAEDAVTYALA